MEKKPFMTRTDLVKKWETQEGANEYKTMMRKNNLSPSEYDNNYLDTVNSYASEGIDLTSNRGWQRYLADADKAKNAPKYDFNSNGKDDWWEYVWGWIKGTDRANAAMNPNDSWKDEQRAEFGDLYLNSIDDARAYAKKINNEINVQNEENAVGQIQKEATNNIFSGALHSLGAVLTSPLQGLDYLSDVVQVIRGQDTADGTLSLGEYSRAVTDAMSDHINDFTGTFGENVPLIGGQGLGDAYEWGIKAAGSAVAGMVFGDLGTIASYFGQGASKAMRSALDSGANEWTAAIYGAAVGAVEAAMEQLGPEAFGYNKDIFAFSVDEIIKDKLGWMGAQVLEESVTKAAQELIDLVFYGEDSNLIRAMSGK